MAVAVSVLVTAIVPVGELVGVMVGTVGTIVAEAVKVGVNVGTVGVMVAEAVKVGVSVGTVGVNVAVGMVGVRVRVCDAVGVKVKVDGSVGTVGVSVGSWVAVLLGVNVNVGGSVGDTVLLAVSVADGTFVGVLRCRRCHGWSAAAAQTAWICVGNRIP